MENSKLVGFACGMALVAAGPIAAAQAAEGFYIGAHGGAVFLEDADTTLSAPVTPITAVSFETEFDAGFLVGGVVGYSFNKVFRVEAEVSYRDNDLDEGTALGISAPIEGDITALAGMANVYFDFRPGKSWRPYFGGGIGVANLDLEFDSIAGIPFSFSDSDAVFAYQAMAGVEYKITPRLSLGAEYRYFATTDPEFDDTVFDGEVDVPVTLESEYHSHNVLVRLRYYFN